MTGITKADKFEKAIIDFGVNSACEYFSVLKDGRLWNDFDGLRKREKQNVILARLKKASWRAK